MSVSGVSQASGSSAADWQSSFKQVSTDFKSLATALSSGDLATAQQAYAQLQKDLPGGSTASSSANNPLAAIGQALQSGNIASAQQAFTALRAGHHGHHHHGGGAAAAPAAVSTSDDDGDSDGPGKLLNSVA